MKKNKEKYYNDTKNLEPHLNIINFLNLNIPPQNGIDLGCGAGRDTIALLKKDWHILSIDKEDTEHIIKKQLTQSELKHFKFQKCTFEKVNLPKTNLIVANFSLPFSKKDIFNNIWKNINNAILSGRLLRWKLLWKKRFLG